MKKFDGKSMSFTKAVKENIFLRALLMGVQKTGKTYSALNIATHLGSRIALIDSEAHSSLRYADIFTFDVQHLGSREADPHIKDYIQAVRDAADLGYDVLVVDSLSHSWMSELALSGGQFQNWAQVRPLERTLINLLLWYPGHVIATARSKSEYVVEDRTTKSGKQTKAPREVGTAPVQSPGVQYEFDVVVQMDHQHTATVKGTRLSLLDGKSFPLPGREFAEACLMSLGALPESKVFSPPASMDELMTQIGQECFQRLTWSKETAKGFLQKHFGVSVRSALSFQQMQQCLELLRDLSPSPTQPLADSEPALESLPPASESNASSLAAEPEPMAAPETLSSDSEPEPESTAPVLEPEAAVSDKRVVEILEPLQGQNPAEKVKSIFDRLEIETKTERRQFHDEAFKTTGLVKPRQGLNAMDEDAAERYCDALVRLILAA
ncbi:MAG: AAA family ATPase [Cyanobacteria bacterium J06638_22]